MGHTKRLLGFASQGPFHFRAAVGAFHFSRHFRPSKVRHMSAPHVLHQCTDALSDVATLGMYVTSCT